MESLDERLRVAGMERQNLSLQERVALLERSRLGAGMGTKELQTLASYCKPWLAGVDTVLFRQGEYSDFLCLVCRGRVAVIREDRLQAGKEIATVGPGQTVGEMALIDREARSASVVVRSPVQVLVLDEESFDRMAEEVPRLWGKVLKNLACVLSRRLRQTSGILAEYLEL
ncbi:cyclic nucleotide-binding domain-containing protein [Trichlorobacter ammonificans]|uniref:Cyclic nucleotide-binding domain-containing protein n=1 Tax=Trichlorobacter ammonificans TaxID=2916410 RepID=A0ABM9D9X5_9BACT|nr:cyclic nucleotide-binding domain-containing protein [Trichlorobacter ammonificans]CAH2032024.1 Cyclic nucleotide-binding domain-containing protein [Trichlorobacter ammonificans]